MIRFAVRSASVVLRERLDRGNNEIPSRLSSLLRRRLLPMPLPTQYLPILSSLVPPFPNAPEFQQSAVLPSILSIAFDSFRSVLRKAEIR